MAASTQCHFEGMAASTQCHFEGMAASTISERQKQQKVVMVLLHLLLFIIGATAGTSHNSDFGK
jgi:hypothetical protein